MVTKSPTYRPRRDVARVGLRLQKAQLQAILDAVAPLGITESSQAVLHCAQVGLAEIQSKVAFMGRLGDVLAPQVLQNAIEAMKASQTPSEGPSCASGGASSGEGEGHS